MATNRSLPPCQTAVAHPYAAVHLPNTTPSATSPRRNFQPKTTRQQCVACGACRLRRVKCDLRNVGTRAGETPTCTNCQERGLKCVDEFVNEFINTKATKQFRNGRILSRVQKLYGPNAQASPDAPATEESAQASSSRTPSCIPKLQPEFFGSPFYRRFHIQRPIVDPTEFSARFYELEQGKPESLGVTGSMICMLLVTWAATYGVSEYGVEEPSNGLEDVRERRRQCNKMVREILGLIDKHILLREPTWDGVRVLLLLLPLTEDVVTQTARQTIYETAISQVYTLCSHGLFVNLGQGDFIDVLVCAQILWYGYVHEGVRKGLRGGKLFFEDDDLSSIQITFTSLNAHSLVRTPITSSYSYRYATAPIRLSNTCRQINAILTGPKAKRQEDVNERSLEEVWEALSRSWEEFEELKLVGPVGIIQPEDTERFVNGWQILIFECHNVIYDSLEQRINYQLKHSINDILHAKLTRLLTTAKGKCQGMAGQVLNLIRFHLGSSFFQYDASLVRDGCFYAGLHIARNSGTEEDIRTCVQALEEMRWAFSKSRERVEALKFVWEDRKAYKEQRPRSVVQMSCAPGGNTANQSTSAPFNSLCGTDPDQTMTIPDGEAQSNPVYPIHRPPKPAPFHGSAVDIHSSVPISGGFWQSPPPPNYFTSHQSSSNTGAATTVPTKMPSIEETELMRNYDPSNSGTGFMGPYLDASGPSPFANDAQFHGYSMPPHGVAVGLAAPVSHSWGHSSTFV